MGMIYSSAKRVVSWLGDEPKVALFIRLMQSVHKKSMDGIHNSDFGETSRFRSQLNHFIESEYWQRAWM